MAVDEVVSQPLIGSEGDDADDDLDQLEASLARPTPFLWVLTLTAGLSGLLFGYDTGVISSTLVSIGTDLSSRALTTLDKSLITSSTSLFALLASPLSGSLSDALGRQRVILLASLLFIAGSLLQALSTTVPLMITGRAIVGLAVGSASFVVPLYISELAPAPFRGRLVTINELLITGGQVIAYLAGWLLSATPHGWRALVGLGALPALLQLALFGAMPETPRWLVAAGASPRAHAVLTRVYGPALAPLTARILRRIRRSLAADPAPTSAWHDLLHHPPHRRALLLACALQAAQQLCGFNSLMYFSATLFALVGFPHPTVPSLSVAATNFAFTLLAFALIDRLGRRRILLCSIPGMALGMALAALAFAHLDLGAAAAGTGDVAGAWPTALLAATTLYVACYAVGLGVVPWQQAELFGLRVRAVGSALATATNWGANTAVGLTFLPLMQLVTPSGAFGLYAGVCVGAWVAIWRVYPETAGLGLEDVQGLLAEGFGVEESVLRWKRRGR